MSSDLEAALALLPAWMPWAPLALVPLTAALTALLLAPLPWLLGGPLPPGVEWPEDARLGFERRRAAILCAYGVSVGFGLLGGLFAGPLSALSPWGLGVLCALSSWLGAQPALARTHRLLLRRPLSTREQLRSSGLTSLIRLGHLLLLLALAGVAPLELSVAHALLMGLYAVVALAWFHGLGLRLARALGLAEPAEARVLGLAQAAASRAGVTLAGVYRLELSSANALALPNTGELLVTGPAERLLGDDELAAILEHEVGHLAEPPGAQRARMAVALGLAPLVLARPLFALWGPPGLLAVFLGLLGVIVLGQRLSRRLEQAADAHAHEVDPVAYARALEALYRYNGVPPVLGLRAGHPDLYDRLVAAGVPPDYPRPEPPGRRRGQLVFFALLLLITFGGLGALITLKRASYPADSPAFLLSALHGGDLIFLLDYADTVEITEDRLALIEGAVALSGGEGWVRLELIEAQLDAGRCAEAEAGWAALLADGWTPPPWDADLARALEGRVRACAGS
ncbi:MAG: M48 family metalloprotease [Alphaproteobacteria bacterium]|nr:M48 family metalloprotease [Alphaproteobacteria bacterium]